MTQATQRGRIGKGGKKKAAGPAPVERCPRPLDDPEDRPTEGGSSALLFVGLLELLVALFLLAIELGHKLLGCRIIVGL